MQSRLSDGLRRQMKRQRDSRCENVQQTTQAFTKMVSSIQQSLSEWSPAGANQERTFDHLLHQMLLEQSLILQTMDDAYKTGLKKMVNQSAQVAQNWSNTWDRSRSNSSNGQKTSTPPKMKPQPVTDEDSKVEDSQDLLEDIDGIGPSYAEQLYNEGITSVADLSQSDSGDILDIIDTGFISREDAESWIEQASLRLT